MCKQGDHSASDTKTQLSNQCQREVFNKATLYVTNEMTWKDTGISRTLLGQSKRNGYRGQNSNFHLSYLKLFDPGGGGGGGGTPVENDDCGGGGGLNDVGELKEVSRLKENILAKIDLINL